MSNDDAASYIVSNYSEQGAGLGFGVTFMWIAENINLSKILVK